MNVAALIAIALKVDARDFAARFPDPMLVVRKRGADESAITTPQKVSLDQDTDWRAGTKMVRLPTKIHTSTGNAHERAPVESLASSSVEPVAKSPRNPFEGMITIGRAPNNDVCLHVQSVSKMHAYFRKENGKWVLRDKHSSNGTFVNGLRLEGEKPFVVDDGTYVLFGPDCECLFKLPLSLHAFLVQLDKLNKKS